MKFDKMLFERVRVPKYQQSNRIMATEPKPQIWIEWITFSGGEKISFEPGSITVIVGPNSSGKTTLLTEIKKWLSGGDFFWKSADGVPEPDLLVVKDGKISKRGTVEEINEWLKSNLYLGPDRHWGSSKLSYQWMEGSCEASSVKGSWEHERLGALTYLLCRVIDVEKRLEVSKPIEAIELFKASPQHPVHALCLDDELEQRISTMFFEAFGSDLVSRRAGGKSIALHVVPQSALVNSPDRAAPAYLKRLITYPQLHMVGHGMRSFAGCLLDVFTSSAFLLLVDEPEVFLHPPHAQLLGTLLARKQRDFQQLLVSTHCSDFLRGVLDSGNPRIKVVRVTRDGQANHAHELGTEKIRQLWADPILRFSNVLDGIFHELTIVCEGDADCRFYSAIADVLQSKEGHRRDIFFTWTNGKDRVSTVVDALRAVGVPTRVIVDFDLLETEQSLAKLVNSLGGKWEALREEWKFLHQQIEARFPKPSPDRIQREISAVLAGEKGLSVSKQGEEKIRESLRAISPWKLAKQSGITVMPNGEPTARLSAFLKQLQALGAFVVERGELERFVPSVGGHGPKWVTNVLTQKDVAADGELEEARRFVSLVMQTPVQPVTSDTTTSTIPNVPNRNPSPEPKSSSNFLRRLFGIALISLGILMPCLSAFAATYFPAPDATGGWRTATNATQARELAAMDLPRLEQAWEFTQRCTQNAGLIVVRNGWLVFEKYAGRASRNANPDMASTGKAYTSIACGIMLQEFRDKIPEGLDTKVFTPSFLPEGSMRALARSDSAPSPVSGDADKSKSGGNANASELPAGAREAARGARAVPEQNAVPEGKFEFDDTRRADITLGQLLCMTGGYNGEGGSPTAVVMGKSFPLKASPGQNIRNLDESSLRCAMWTNAGAGYSYSSPEPHIASMVLRRVTGMELDKYIDERLAKPMGWSAWGYCLNRGGFRMPHANGAGSIAVHATDALRFGYCLAHGGKWGNQQIVPADYLALCNKMSPHNPHCPYTLQFEQNSDGHVIGAPRDAFWKSGAGGFALIIVPSLDLVIYKMGGNNGQYDPTLTDVPQPEPSHARDEWKPIQGTPFVEGSRGGDDGIRRALEMVCAAVVPW